MTFDASIEGSANHVAQRLNSSGEFSSFPAMLHVNCHWILSTAYEHDDSIDFNFPIFHKFLLIIAQFRIQIKRLINWFPGFDQNIVRTH